MLDIARCKVESGALYHKIVLTGDYNLPKVDWITYSSTDEYENEILSLVINNMKQIIDFKTTSTSIYDLILTNSDADIIHAERDSNFTENFSNHYAVVFELAFCTQVSSDKTSNHGLPHPRCTLLTNYQLTEIH